MAPMSHTRRSSQGAVLLAPAQLAAAALCVVLAGCDHGGGARGGKWEALRAEAEAMARGGQGVEAARLIARSVESLPPAERGEARLVVARLFLAADVPAAAEENARAALALGSRSAECFHLAGESLRRLARLTEAEEMLGKALAIDPAHRSSKLSLARLRFRSGDPAEALPLFEEYFRGAAPDEDAGPDGAEREEAILEHGRALRAAGRNREAAGRFIDLLEMDPLEAPYYSELASSLYRLRLRQEAKLVEEIFAMVSASGFEEHVEKGLERSGSSAFALGQRGANLQRRRRYREAFRAYRRAVEIDPREPRLRMFLAELCLRFRRTREAADLLEEGIRTGAAPSSGLLWLLARAELEAGRPMEALDAAERAERSLSQEGTAAGVERGQAPLFSLLLTKARAAFECGDLAPAESSAARAQAASPQAWEPWYWRGRIAAAMGKDPLPLLEEAARRGGAAFPDLLHARALALERVGRTEEARREVQRALASSPAHLPSRDVLLRLAPEGPGRAEAE